MNKFLCSLACTWITIIDIDSFHWNEMLTWWLPGCICTTFVWMINSVDLSNQLASPDDLDLENNQQKTRS